MVPIVGWLKRDGLEFAHIQLPIAVQYAFVNAHIHNLTDDVAVLAHFQEFALQSYRQLIMRGASTDSLLVQWKPDFSIFFGSLFADTMPT